MGKHTRKRNHNNTAKNIAIGATVVLGGSVVSTGIASAATDAQWEAVAIPEAGGDWTINHSGDGMSVGGLQFQNASWQDALAYLRTQGIDTSSFPPTLYQYMDNVPTKAQQMLAGEALLHLQGPGAWANGNGSGLGASMFDGGEVPATVAASGLLAGTKWDTGADPAPDPAPAPTPTDEAPPSRPTHPKPKPHPSTGHRPGRGACHYTVVSGDWLAKIAAREGVKGGWRPLYEANKRKIGSNPNLIYPGQVFHLPGGCKVTSKPVPAPKPKPKPAPSKDYVLPTQGLLTQGYGNPGPYGLGYHTGIDLSAPQGTPVVAAAAGTVVSINASGSPYGNHVVVKHADGHYTLYAHLSAYSVHVGQALAAGEQLGNVGSTGTSSGPHLHFEVRNDPTQYAAWVFIDPAAWLRSHGVSI